MIHALDAKTGQHRAKAICDDCGRDEVVAANVECIKGKPHIVNEGQVVRKVEAQGWALVKGKLRCPICEAKRRTGNHSKKEQVMAVKERPGEAAPREPGYKMVAEIVQMLEVAYDRNARRYGNPADTDKTIAAEIGNGCLWGWVAKIRESEFGPDTRNAEAEKLKAEIRQLDGDIAAIRDGLSKVETQAAAIRQRLDKVA